MGPYKDIFSEPFLPGHISHSVEGDDHTKADSASVASNGAGDEVKASADDFDDGLFQRSCHAPWLEHSPRCAALWPIAWSSPTKIKIVKLMMYDHPLLWSRVWR